MIDTHAHIHLMAASPDEVWQSARAQGIRHIIQVAIDMNSLALNQTHFSALPWCSITAGIHPLSVAKTPCLDTALFTIESMMPSIVAVGEIGLDYKYGRENAAEQRDFFYRQLRLADQYNKPVIIHSRHCDDDMVTILNEFSHLKKVVHCYATHIQFFESLAGSSNYVSFTGLITYAKSGKVIRALKAVPLNRIMIETDAPYLRPREAVTSAGNSPANLGAIADAVAHHRSMSREDVIKVTTENAMQFFSIF